MSTAIELLEADNARLRAGIKARDCPRIDGRCPYCGNKVRTYVKQGQRWEARKCGDHAPACPTVLHPLDQTAGAVSADNEED